MLHGFYNFIFHSPAELLPHPLICYTSRTCVSSSLNSSTSSSVDFHNR